VSAQARPAGEVSVISGNMTMDNAAALLAQGTAALAKGITRFDLSAVAHIDSSGLAVLFAWLRAARVAGKTLSIDNPPHSLRSLAGVYGVTELLPLS
jgi:phospholipid transport system transporter-binding protein